MAGLKASQLSDNPVAFWTFEFDRTGFTGNLLTDEIGNQSPMIVNSDMAGDNYWLERQSLNEIETADQYAMSVALDQKIDDHWRSQFFEVVHTNRFEFPDKGEFSVEWLMYKIPPDQIRNQYEPGYRSDIVTPLISKGSVLGISIIDGYYSNNDRIAVNVVGRNLECHNSTYPIWNRSLHCVVTYKVTQTDVNEYVSVAKLWINGHLIDSDEKTHIDTYPNTNTSASWLFCGNGGSNPRKDFASERLTMDQIAVYPYALTTEQVANHYRKTKQYDRMIIDDRPQHYWRLDETDDPLDTTITYDVGSVDGKYIGAVNRYRPGPDRLANSRAPFFQKGSSGYLDDFGSRGIFDPIISPNQNYTLEFWFRAKDNDRGLIFDCSEESPVRKWAGIRVYLNTKNNAHAPGNIQVSESLETHLSSRDLDGNGDRYLFNDDEWHHLVMQRQGNTLRLYLDGFLHEEGEFAKTDIGRPGQIHLMNGRPGEYPVEGYLCEVAFYQRALQKQQIYNRYIFSTRYKVSGYTLLQGAPVEATLRFYDSVSGELVNTVRSNSLTGEYVFYPLNNRHLDIVSKLDGNTTRNRIHGPVAPAEYDDTHLR